MLLLRRMRDSDYRAVDGLLMQLHRMDVAGRPDLFAQQDHYMPQESFAYLLKNENVLALVAQERGQTLGCCFVSLLERQEPKPRKAAYIDLLVVDEAHRRQGIGKALFREIQKRAKALGAQSVELMVWSYNTNAVKAYQAYGMTPQRSIYEISV